MTFKDLFYLLFSLIISFPVFGQNKSTRREKQLIDADWRFAFGHPSDPAKDFGNGTGYFSYLAKAGYGDGAAAAGFDDRSWRRLDLPHDWAVEQGFSAAASFSHGFKAIGRGFPDKSIGWYRKHFTVLATDLGRRIVLQFDGVFRNSIVWVNGHYLGTEPSGYNSFQYDITDVLNYGGDNVIAVRVDATMEEGWYYEGAGIYRHVWLTKTDPVHVAANGTFVTSFVNGRNGIVSAQAEITNEAKVTKSISVVQSIIDAKGNIVSSLSAGSMVLKPFGQKQITSALVVPNARLWDLSDPYRYQLITILTDGKDTIDRYSTTFGIRTIRFDAQQGFFLNGKPVKLKGTNNHQDHAGVGTAMPDSLVYWRIRQLKEMGSNAYRCSHHPPSPEVLDACDRLGMLVIDESRLMRTTNDGLNELGRMIRRDRNHPSVICWSIGNEEWAMENNSTGVRIATTLQAYANSLDSTRPVTAGISGGFRSGISDVLEVMGYNYMGNGDIDAHHKQFPQQPAMGTEEGSTYATRGVYVTDDQKHYQAAYDKKPRSSFYSIEEGWKFYAARPYLSGMFIWTGFDYRGEPTPYGWPSVTSYFGMMDLCGFPKDNVYYLRSWWSDKPVLHLLPHWNWHGREGKPVDIWVYSNCDDVELFLNKKSLGKKKMEPNGHLEWVVNYMPGTLAAIGYKNGKKVLSDKVQTTGTPTQVQLTADKQVLHHSSDIAMITVSVQDQQDNTVPVANNDIHFSITGPGKIIGVGNGDPASLEKEKFIDSIQTVAIERLEEKEVTEMDAPVDLTDTVSAEWKKAFSSRNYRQLASGYLTRGSFVLPEQYSGSAITLFYKDIGTVQSIYINGKEIAHEVKQGGSSDGYVLDKTILKPGRNTIYIWNKPIPKKYEWDNINSDPGLIQIYTPATNWHRKLFNGLAQVIVQATGEKGNITISAAAPGLKSKQLIIKTVPDNSKPD